MRNGNFDVNYSCCVLTTEVLLALFPLLFRFHYEILAPFEKYCNNGHFTKKITSNYLPSNPRSILSDTAQHHHALPPRRSTASLRRTIELRYHPPPLLFDKSIACGCGSPLTCGSTLPARPQQPMEDARGGRAELVGSPERRRRRAVLPADMPVVSGSLFLRVPQLSSSVSPIILQQGGVINLRCDACCVLHGSHTGSSFMYTVERCFAIQ